MRSLRAGAVLALALSMIAAPSRAQDRVPDSVPAAPVPQDSLQAALTRFRTLETRVNGVQNQALQASPELQAEQDSIQSALEAAVYEAHPELEQVLKERMPEIQQEAAAAQAAQDATKLKALQNEYQGIMGRLQDAQGEVLEQEEMKARLEAFQDAMMVEMVKLDPEVDEMFAELKALADRLDATDLNVGG